MRNWTIAILPLALAMTATGCSGADHAANGHDGSTRAQSGTDGGSSDRGPASTRDFGLDGFTGVKVAGPDDVTIRQGDTFSIRAKGPKDELDTLEIEVDGSMLSIDRKREGFSFRSINHQGVQIAVTMPRLDSVRLSGSGSIDADKIEGDSIEAVLSGSGDLKVASFSGGRAKVKLSGSGDIDIAGGTIKSGDFGITGSGDIGADGLTAETLDISVAGSGNVDTKATGTADISIMGSGDVTIAGGAKCSTHTMGSGDATCK